MRFMYVVKELTHADAARLTRIDYDREMALVALRQRVGKRPGSVAWCDSATASIARGRNSPSCCCATPPASASAACCCAD